MKKLFIIACICLLALNIAAQNKQVDSLKKVLSTTTKPIDRFTVLIAISQVAFTAGDTDSATCTELLQIAQQLKNDSLLAISYNIIGQYVSRVKGDNTTGLDYFFKAIPLAEKAHDKRRLSSIYFDMAMPR